MALTRRTVHRTGTNLSNDGGSSYLQDTQSNVTFTTLVNASGDAAAVASVVGVLINAGSTTDRWDIIRRGGMSFPTDGLSSHITILSAKIRLHVDAQQNPMGEQDIGIYGFTPANADTHASGDYDAVTSVRMDSSSNTDGASVGEWVEFELNASGIAAISTSARTSFSLRYVADATDDATLLTWIANNTNLISFDSADTAADYAPQLIVTYEVDDDYETLVLSDSPVGYWPLDETSGTTADDRTANGYDGTYVNTPTLGSTNLVPQQGDTSALFDDASSERVDLPSSFLTAVSGNTAGSIEFWFKRDDTTNEDEYFTFSTGGGDRLVVEVNPAVNHSIRLVIREANFNLVGIYATGGLTCNDTEIHHVVVTQDGTSAKVFMDGYEATSYGGGNGGEWVADVTSLSDVYINYDPSGTSYGSGNIGHVAYYDVALSAEQVADHFACAQAYGFSKVAMNLDPFAYYRLNTADYENEKVLNLVEPTLDGSYSAGAVGFTGLLTNDDYDEATDFPFGDKATVLDPGERFAFNVGEPFSMATWFQWDSGASAYHPIIVKYGAGGAQVFWLRVNDVGTSDYRFDFSLRTNSTNGFVTGGTTVATATTYFVVVTYDGTDLRLYVDGAEDTPYDTQTTASGTVDNTTQKLEIMDWDSIPRSTNGKQQEVLFFDYQLSASEITTLYNTGIDNLGVFQVENETLNLTEATTELPTLRQVANEALNLVEDTVRLTLTLASQVVDEALNLTEGTVRSFRFFRTRVVDEALNLVETTVRILDFLPRSIRIWLGLETPTTITLDSETPTTVRLEAVTPTTITLEVE